MILMDYPNKKGYCHLVSDNIDELHMFAKRIGVNKCWFENKRNKNHPHYDIKGNFINLAIENGAIQVTSKEIVYFIKKYYK